jgi:hypothetical protein
MSFLRSNINAAASDLGAEPGTLKPRAIAVLRALETARGGCRALTEEALRGRIGDRGTQRSIHHLLQDMRELGLVEHVRRTTLWRSTLQLAIRPSDALCAAIGRTRENLP